MTWGYRLCPAAQTVGELADRSLTPAQPHWLVLCTLDGLAAGATLALVDDHGPLPLRYQLHARGGDHLSGDYLESGINLEGPDRQAGPITSPAPTPGGTG
jgi:uncharacterized protein (DUF2249 family)